MGILTSVTNGEVPEPVGGNGQGHGLGTNVEREDLSTDNPSDGTPGGGEVGDVDADEGNEHSLADQVIGGDGNTNDGDEELADTHAGGTVQEELATSDPLDQVDTGEGHDDVDNVGGDGHGEGVANTRVL